jgi:hypothetical protein
LGDIDSLRRQELAKLLLARDNVTADEAADGALARLLLGHETL